MSRNQQRGGKADFSSVFLWLGWEFADAMRKVLLGPRRAAGTAPIHAAAADEASERAADRNLEPKRQTAAHQHWGTAWVVCAVLISFAAGVGFLFVYWTSASLMWLGITMALFWGGLGVSLVLYARWLMPDKQAEEPREPLPSSAGERAKAAAAFYDGARDIPRHGLLKTIALAAAGVVAAMAVSLFRSLGRSPDPILFSRVWKRGQRLTDSNGTPVSVNTLEPGSTLIVFPEDKIGDERAQTVLIRVDERLIPRDRRASWAPKGYLAYSRVCTHAGCPVGLYEVTTCQLMCPCHQSTFDVLRGARPTGGPAARPLPQLPLYADADGTLRAADGFTTPPGPGFWGMPPSPPDWGTS